MQKGNKSVQLMTVLLENISVPLPHPAPFGGVTSGVISAPPGRAAAGLAVPLGSSSWLGAACAWLRSAWAPPAQGKLAGSKASTFGKFSVAWKPSRPPFLPLHVHLLQDHMSQAGTAPAPNKSPWSAQSHQLGAGGEGGWGGVGGTAGHAGHRLASVNAPAASMGQ